MNCQEFRSRWMDETDEAALSHVETCDDCLQWVETSLTGDEEVRLFMKEYPQPSPHLEERIMEEIYSSSSHPSAMPPLTATIHPEPAQGAAIPKMKRRFSPFVWTGAAGLFVALGLLGLQALQVGSHQATSGTATKTGSEYTANSQTPDAQPHSANKTVPPTNERATYPSSQAIAKATPPANVEDNKSQPATLPAQVPSAADKTITAFASPVPGLHEPESRSAQTRHVNSKQPKAKEGALAASPTDGGARPGSADTDTPVAKQPQPTETTISSLALADEEPQADTGATGEAAPPAAQPEAPGILGAAGVSRSPAASLAANDPAAKAAPFAKAKQSVTMANFTDVETAANASDLPIPVPGLLPAGFALDSLSLTYESQTSKHVTQSTSVYRHGEAQITIQVTRNDKDKRPLSVPGTFSDRRLFVVEGNQAIGVTYDTQSSDKPAQHAVHFLITKNDTPLYVIINGNGISLDALIDLAKSIAWK